MFGKHVAEPKKDDETNEMHEERTWQQKVNVNGDGQLYMQPFACKNSLESAAKWLKRKIKGENRATYIKRFVSGVICTELLLLEDHSGKPLTLDDVDPVRLFVPSNGERGSGKRVFKIFPTVHEWSARGSIIVFDSKITEDVLRDHLVAVGRFIGWGSMRVENGGINGRFKVDNFAAQEIEETVGV